MGHILNHNKTPFICNLDCSEYYDLFLSEFYLPSRYNEDSKTVSERCLIAHMDFNDACCVWFENLYSKPDVYWEDGKNEGLVLENVGFTGVDNGIITFDKNKITNKEFDNLFKHSRLEIEKDNLRFSMRKVCGNNKIFNYDNDLVEEDNILSARLNGGFYQGFYKSYDYEVLPNNFNGGASFEFVLKPTDFEETNGITLNYRHPENKGIFFYIGARSENKWYKNFNVSYSFEKIYNTYFAEDYVSNEYFSDGDINANYMQFVEEDEVITECDNYIVTETECKEEEEQQPTSPCKIKYTYPEALNVYQSNTKWFGDNGFFWEDNERLRVDCNCISERKKRTCKFESYFDGCYLANDPNNNCDCAKTYFNGEYVAEPFYIDVNEELITTNGRSVEEPNIIEIETNNKFLLFDRTCEGYTVDNWDEEGTYVVTDVKVSEKENYFLLFDRTCNGKTVDDFENKNNKDYDIFSDLYRNAFALKINEDGSIGYKYLVRDCDNEDNKYKILSDFSNPNLIKKDEWNIINVKVVPIGCKSYDSCRNECVPEKIKLMFYVNSKLRFVSKELPPFNFRLLNDFEDKQETVPFNISLGGGTQGLCDVIYYDYKKLPTDVLPLEKEFGGTFIGYIKSFKIYSCPNKLSEIVQNTNFETSFFTN